MKLVDLYVINGLVDSNGNYLKKDNFRTIIAECVGDTIDQGHYYFAIMVIAKNRTKGICSFVEIYNLMGILKESNYAHMHKLCLSEQYLGSIRTYVENSYKAKKEIDNLDMKINVDSSENLKK